MKPRSASISGVLAVLFVGCRPSNGPASSTGPGDAGGQDTAIASDIAWQPLGRPKGCALNLMEAPRIVADAATYERLLVPHTPDCHPDVVASSFDFGRSRILVWPVPGAGFNPNTQETIVPKAVVLEGPQLVVRIDVPPHCGGDERGPGYVAIVLPAGDQPVTVRNQAPSGCNYGDGGPPP